MHDPTGVDPDDTICPLARAISQHDLNVASVVVDDPDRRTPGKSDEFTMLGSYSQSRRVRIEATCRVERCLRRSGPYRCIGTVDDGRLIGTRQRFVVPEREEQRDTNEGHDRERGEEDANPNLYHGWRVPGGRRPPSRLGGVSRMASGATTRNHWPA